MKQYLLLQHPSHARIFDAKTALLEIIAIGQSLGEHIAPTDTTFPSLPNAVCFEAVLTDQLAERIAIASSFYALFEVRSDGALLPCGTNFPFVFPESMPQMLKYQGKTNELFTRLLVNLTQSAAKATNTTPRMLDPMSGKGTSLYEGIIRGWDVLGIEINNTWCQETATFVIRFMKEGRYKHKVQHNRMSNVDKGKVIDALHLTAAASREAYDRNEVQTLQLYHTDTRHADKLMRRNSIDMIVCDLPYGVQHGSKQERGNTQARSPHQLVDEALPAWLNVLKRGGAIGLSFNEHTLRFEAIAKLLEQHGMEIVNSHDCAAYRHRVDQSIIRNLIVARKP